MVRRKVQHNDSKLYNNSKTFKNIKSTPQKYDIYFLFSRNKVIQNQMNRRKTPNENPKSKHKSDVNRGNIKYFNHIQNPILNSSSAYGKQVLLVY